MVKAVLNHRNIKIMTSEQLAELKELCRVKLTELTRAFLESDRLKSDRAVLEEAMNEICGKFYAEQLKQNVSFSFSMLHRKRSGKEFYAFESSLFRFDYWFVELR